VFVDGTTKILKVCSCSNPVGQLDAFLGNAGRLLASAEKLNMVKESLLMFLLLGGVACSRPANMPPEQSGSSAPQAEVKLTTPVAYPSGSTQQVLLSANTLDDSKGMTSGGSGACSTSGTANKTSPGTFKVAVTISAQPQDGSCPVKLTSAANGATGSATLSYTADPTYWKSAAPAMYSFANSKVWTFHSGNDVRVFKLLEASPSPGNKLAVLLVGDKDARAGISVGQDNSVVGEYQGCVVEGKLNGSMAVLKPMDLSENCKGITTVTLIVSN
jgi:hypothetical protein